MPVKVEQINEYLFSDTVKNVKIASNLLIKTFLKRLANKVLNSFSLENHIERLTSISSLPVSII